MVVVGVMVMIVVVVMMMVVVVVNLPVIRISKKQIIHFNC